MENRTLLAIALSVAILIGYQYFYIKTVPHPAPVQAPAKGKAQEGSSKPAPVAPPQILPQTGMSGAEKTVTIDNDLYTAVFTSRGATLKSIALKKFKDKNGSLITLRGDAALPPLALGVDDGFQFSNVNFAVSGGDINLTPSASAAALTFEYSSDGHSIRRTYTFHYDNYAIDLKDEVNGLDSYWITLGRDFGPYEGDTSVHYGPVILRDSDRMEFVTKKLAEPKSFRDGIKWIAQEDKYFFSSIVPKGQVEEAKVWSSNANALVAMKVKGGTNDYLLYAGPKENDRLKKLNYGLEYIVDFGFFSIIARPLFWVLKLFYSIFHNYGVAIIFLTIMVRIPFIPLVSKGQKSMKKLQDIQPRMAEVKAKYKDDPQRMQKELMELYKKHKVNPVGGCLPMLLQIPFFFALYKVLLISIELRSAPFMLWIHDLSAPDRLFGQLGGINLGGPLPILMGITMVIQQRMTPSTMDPSQQKIMMLMPVVFTFMFLSFPSGLVLYWLVNNLLSIGQQMYTNRKMEKQPAA